MRLESLRDTFFENVPPTDKSFTKHFHETYTVGVTHDGVFKSNVLGIIDYSYGHSTRIINPGEVHGGDSQSWHYTNFYPTVELMSEIYRQIFGERKVPLFEDHIIDDEQLYGLLVGLFAAVYHDEEALVIETRLIEALSYLIRHHTHTTQTIDTPLYDTAIIKHSVEMIHDLLESNLSLEMLSRNAGLSKYHFLRIFKHHTGITPHHYILTQRIHRATRCIMAGDSISEASIAAGFSDQSHFTRKFKRVYGYTPHHLIKSSNIILYK